jgi:hypothetical protein
MMTALCNALSHCLLEDAKMMHTPHLNKKLWEELIAYFLLILHGPHIKQCIQQFFYCYAFIRCRGNDFTDPFSNDDKGDNIQAYRLMGGIYEVRR